MAEKTGFELLARQSATRGWRTLFFHVRIWAALTALTVTALALAGCTGKPTSLTTFALQEPITIEASALEELRGEPPLSGKVVLAVVATSRVTSTEDMACGSGLMQAKGVFLAVHYTVTNDANSRIQPATQINYGLALADGRGRRWTGNSARGHCFLEAQLAAQRGGDGPESWVEGAGSPDKQPSYSIFPEMQVDFVCIPRR